MRMTFIKQFQQFLKAMAIPADEVLQAAQIPNTLWKGEIELSTSDYIRLMNAFDAAFTDEKIIAFSDISKISLFMPGFFAALCSQNGFAALKRFAKYKRLTGPILVDVTETSSEVTVSLSFIDEREKLPRFVVLNEQLLMLSMLKTGSGHNIVPIQVAAPFKYGDLISNYLGIETSYATKNSLTFSKKDLEIPFQTKNNAMLEYLEPELGRKLQELLKQENFVDLVRSKLFYAIPSGKQSVADVARSLGISVRTLHRNLSIEHTTFNQQVKYIQKELALSYLRNQNLNTNEIAYLVGYADPNSFSRAFKTWTGTTITQYKKRVARIS
ncbi:helix-turn-helix domain-containing protein [Pediococcus siamensis]|uniref:AraC family transcriptional regulator n=1 Tax=Pediococcus siamensis TaxID=381829 RepID=UPI00399F2B6C